MEVMSLLLLKNSSIKSPKEEEEYLSQESGMVDVALLVSFVNGLFGRDHIRLVYKAFVIYFQC